MKPLDDETYMLMLANVTKPGDIAYINRHYSIIYYKDEELSEEVYSIATSELLEGEPIIKGYTFMFQDKYYLLLRNGWIKAGYVKR